MPGPIITLLTDFGHSDYFVAAMKGVILGICPDARLVDVTHEIPPFQIAQASWLVEMASQTFPADTIHLVVVDPGVGSERRALVARARGQFFVAPDNGVLTRVLAGESQGEIRELTSTRYFRQSVSSTFHGRDLFAPVAAHLACGTVPGQLGPLVHDPVRLADPVCLEVEPGLWRGEILWLDHFGNIVTSFRAETFNWLQTRSFELRINGRSVVRYARYYRCLELGVPALVPGSAGFLEVSLNQSHAGIHFAAQVGAELLLLAPSDSDLS
jgi:S-adenosylmethionine hydrolase